MRHEIPDAPLKRADVAAALLWGAGLVSFCVAWRLLNQGVVNVVTYQIEELAAPPTAGSYVPSVIALASLVVLALLRRASSRPPFEATTAFSALRAGVPLLGVVAVTALWASGLRTPGFVTACAVAVCAGWAVGRLGDGVRPPRGVTWVDRSAPWFLGSAIVASTVWHTAQQVDLWRHFMFGYADFGFFTTELEYCLPWKDVPERFADTRMGYHFIPMFYALAPAYALFRTPAFLMCVGPLAINLAAVAFYQLAKDRSRSPATAVLIALSWLALPSVSRLPYANTYGFQSVHLAVPWLAFAWALAARGRWTSSHACLAGAMLCEETVCGVGFGWGVYLVLFGHKRRTGVAIAVASLGYLALCTLVLVPAFSGSSAYTRLGLFGELAPASFLERLMRPRVPLYLIALAAPMLVGLWRGWRLLIVAVPTLLLVLLMQNSDYLNIKYWHQSSVLPVLFVGAAIGVTSGRAGKSKPDGGASSSVGPPLGLFVTCLLLHQVLGFSPLAQAYRPVAANLGMRPRDDCREALRFVRSRYPADATTIAATERLAAHFCDYRMVHPLSRWKTSSTTLASDVLALDRSDRWDSVVRGQRVDRVISEAITEGYATVGEFGTVVVLARRQR